MSEWRMPEIPCACTVIFTRGSRANGDIDTAVFYPDDEQFLNERDPTGRRGT